jgi:hypothetical protein
MAGRVSVLAAPFLGAALLGAALLGAGLAFAAAAKTPPPQLRVTSRSPVTVVGSNFRPRERVVVRLGQASALRRVVRATTSGTFLVRFAVSSDPCNDGLFVTASGASSETATLKLNARMCAPAP